MKDKIQLIRRMLFGSLLLVLALVTACNPTGVEERVAMTLTALFTLQPSITNTATSEPSATLTFTLPPPPMIATDPLTPTPTPTPTLTDTPKPTCFRLLNPPDGAYLQSTGKLYFEWEPLDGAEKYLLDVSAPYDRKQAFETSNTSVLRWLNTLPWEGPYTWQVTALDANGKVLCIVGTYNFNKPKFKPTPTPRPGHPNWFILINTPEGTCPSQ